MQFFGSSTGFICSYNAHGWFIFSPMNHLVTSVCKMSLVIAHYCSFPLDALKQCQIIKIRLWRHFLQTEEHNLVYVYVSVYVLFFALAH